MLHLRVNPNKHEIKLYHIEGFVITIFLRTSNLPSLLKGEFTEDLYGIKVNSPGEKVKYVTARFKNNKDGELEVTYCYNPALAESFTHKVIPFGTFSEDGLSVTSYNDITLTVLSGKSSFKEELLRNNDLSVSKNTILRCLHSSGDSIKEPTEVHVLKVRDAFAIYNRNYLPCLVLMFIHTDDFTVKEEDSMSSEETVQEDVLVKTDPFYLKVVERVDGFYLHGAEGRVIYIDLKSKHFDSLLKGKFRALMHGVGMKGDTAGQKYLITFETDQNDQLTMKYSYADESIPEVFVSEVHVLGNISKDRDSVTTKDGNVLKSFMLSESLSDILLECEDGEPHTRYLHYKHKGSLDFKVLQVGIVKNNSILTINNYFGELITHILVEDLLGGNEESSKENVSEYSLSGVCPTGPDLYVSFDALRKYNFLSSKKYGFNLIVELGISINSQTRGQLRGRILPEGRPMSTNVLITFEVCPDGQICAFIYRENNHTFFPHQTTVHRLFFEEHKDSKVKTDECVKEIPEMTEVKDPTKNMLTAEEARRLSNANLFNIFTQLNDKVSNAIDEVKRYIVIEPNTTIPAEVRDTVLKTLREDLGYNVGVSISGEISISW